MRNHSNFFSFPLPLSYFERKVILKLNSHKFRVESVFWSLGSFRDLPKKVSEAWQMQSSVLHDLESQRRKVSSSQLVARVWRAQVHWVDQAQRVFCYLCTPTLFSSRSITTWRAVEKFFAKFFSFFLITSLGIILCLHLSSLTLVL